MKIALLPGDGIGPEIVREAAHVLDALRRDGLPITTASAPIGGAGYDAAGHPLPKATLELAQACDAVLMGAVGGPTYDTLPRELRPEQGILGIIFWRDVTERRQVEERLRDAENRWRTLIEGVEVSSMEF